MGRYKIIRNGGKASDAEILTRLEEGQDISTSLEIGGVPCVVLLRCDGREYDPQEHACCLSWRLIVAQGETGEIDLDDPGDLEKRTVGELKLSHANLQEIAASSGVNFMLWMLEQAQDLVTITA